MFSKILSVAGSIVRNVPIDAMVEGGTFASGPRSALVCFTAPVVPFRTGEKITKLSNGEEWVVDVVMLISLKIRVRHYPQRGFVPPWVVRQIAVDVDDRMPSWVQLISESLFYMTKA